MPNGTGKINERRVYAWQNQGGPLNGIRMPALRQHRTAVALLKVTDRQGYWNGLPLVCHMYVVCTEQKGRREFIFGPGFLFG